MRIALQIIALAVGLSTATIFARPGGFDSGSNLCGTNLTHTNLTRTNLTLGPWSQYDTNGDGTLTTIEFLAAKTALIQQRQNNFLAKYDGNSDGTVTSAEILAVTQAAATRWLTNVLAHADRNHDGTLSTNEFRNARGGPEEPSLAELDIDGDGVISNAELVTGALALAVTWQAEVLDKYDANKDGMITTVEALAGHQAEADDWLADLLATFDANGDGAITAAEVSAVPHGRPGGRGEPEAR